MCDCFGKIDAFLASSGNRDKMMALVQFLPLALYGPASEAGCPSLGKSLKNLSNMADSYRAITRLTLLAGALSKGKLNDLVKPKGDIIMDRLDIVAHAFHVFFVIFENTAVFSGQGVYPSHLGRLGGCAVTCWFYVLLLGIVKALYQLTQTTLSNEEKKGVQLTLVKLGCFFIFCMSCIPAGGPQLLENVSGPLVPIHKLLRVIAPKHVALPDTVRGTLGFVASVCDFY